jgi:hypothetical protein
MWRNGGPGSHIPQRVKDAVNARQDDMCACIDKRVCWGTIDEYDHITNVASTGMDRRELNRDPDLLQGLCRPCHQVKTQAEARAGKQRRSGKRRPRVHPADVHNHAADA